MKKKFFGLLFTAVMLQHSVVANANSVFIQQVNNADEGSQVAVVYQAGRDLNIVYQEGELDHEEDGYEEEQYEVLQPEAREEELASQEEEAFEFEQEEIQQLKPYPIIGGERSKEQIEAKKLSEDGAYGTYVCEHDISNAEIKEMKAKDRFLLKANFSKSRIFEYSFICHKTGFHTFSVDEEVSADVSADLIGFDQSGEKYFHVRDLKATNSIPAKFNAGESYTIRIEASEDSAAGLFNIYLTLANDVMILYPGTRLKDSITSPGQVNGYFFVPQETGLYRFYFESIDAGLDFDLNLCEFPTFKLDPTTYRAWKAFNKYWNSKDREDYKTIHVERRFVSSGNNALVARLEAGKTYYVFTNSRWYDHGFDKDYYRSYIMRFDQLE